MSEFSVGQRWVVDSEPELGLGTVTRIEGRSVRIYFELGQCERTYASQNAPLTRIQYSVDEEIAMADGEKGVVNAIQRHNGLVFYSLTCGKVVPETALSPKIEMNQPFIRLVTGQLDKPLWFTFKRQLSDAVTRLWQSGYTGLLGIRANLIPHQLYVAWSACSRQRVRVLLADEVGLGKTLEAGMILSRLMKLERCHRALIVVPEALQVQWLVELIRRFSLHAELYKGLEHDFNEGRIHIITHDILSLRTEALLETNFDLLIVDEAHHISPNSEDFADLRLLCEATKHLVLLTATPEQLGVESHFARLQLLDHAKFPDFEKFLAQEKNYIELNRDIRNLAANRSKIIDRYQLDVSEQDSDETLIAQLLDCHGVGRVMFRNVRSAVKGFPRRVAKTHTLPDDTWESKYEWLGMFLKANPKEKVLVICHHIDNVSACEDYLWRKHGLDAAVFHEEQDLIERDRAAAYFSDSESGAQVLLCSEIGSEGRNFQFSANLVCLDLPAHPDVLEQRIGRLDRIGQARDINIHLLYCENTAGEVRLRWYHEVLNCIAEQNPAAAAVHDLYWERLGGSLENGELVNEAKACLQKLQLEISQGRDALLELNSCRQPMADDLAKNIAEFEKACPHSIVELASDLLQFYFEETRSGVYSIIPSDKMLIPALPGIPPEGCEITFSRDIAAQRDDILFVSWDAPLIEGLHDLLQYSELGSAAVAVLPSRNLPAGHCLLEASFDVILSSEHAAECRPFLPSNNVRTVALDMSDKDLSAALPEQALQNSLQEVKRNLAKEIIKSKKDDIPAWYKKCEHFSLAHKNSLIEKAIANAEQFFNNEIQRLRSLQKRNPLIDDDDIDDLANKKQEVVSALREHTNLHLAALRLIIISD